MSGVISRVVTRVSALPSSAGAFVNTDISYDYAIGGTPFLCAPSKDRPMERYTADYRKQQFDTSAEPGEQSLLSWWLRSQSSFHGGTGIKFQEPDSAYPTNVFRFQDSLGVDVWTQGQVTLLPAMTQNKVAAGTARVLGAIDGSTDIYLQSDGTSLFRCLDGSSAAVTWGGAGSILSLAQDGSSYYAADATGIYKGTLAGGAGALIWNTGSANVTIGWVKQRLMAGVGASLYELNSTGAGGPALPAAKYTHPDSNWRWTSITETATAILAAGYSGSTSAVYKFMLDTSGVVPTTAATGTTQLPAGEVVHAIYGYLGDFVAIGSSKGVRIASVDANGDLAYGPLTLTTTNPVRAFVGKDRFVYAAAENALNGKSGVWRIDLGTQTDFRKFAYATDLQTQVTGIARGVALFGASGRLVIGVDAQGSYLESATVKEATGYLQTGNIRMHTLEPKLFKFVRYRGLALAGGMSVSVISPGGAETTVVTYSVASTNPYDEGALPTTVGPQEYVSLRFSFTRAASTTDGPTMNGYQLKALPAAKRQRVFRLPLLCFDYEKDQNGVTFGGEGHAITRLEALEAIEEAGDLVTVQDLSLHPTANHLCVIDQVLFTQVNTPADTSGWGGYVYVTLRSVT